MKTLKKIKTYDQLFETFIKLNKDANEFISLQGDQKALNEKKASLEENEIKKITKNLNKANMTWEEGLKQKKSEYEEKVKHRMDNVDAEVLKKFREAVKRVKDVKEQVQVLQADIDKLLGSDTMKEDNKFIKDNERVVDPKIDIPEIIEVDTKYRKVIAELEAKEKLQANLVAFYNKLVSDIQLIGPLLKEEYDRLEASIDSEIKLFFDKEYQKLLARGQAPTKAELTRLVDEAKEKFEKKPMESLKKGFELYDDLVYKAKAIHKLYEKSSALPIYVSPKLDTEYLKAIRREFSARLKTRAVKGDGKGKGKGKGKDETKGKGKGKGRGEEEPKKKPSKPKSELLKEIEEIEAEMKALAVSIDGDEDALSKTKIKKEEAELKRKISKAKTKLDTLERRLSLRIKLVTEY